MVHCYLNSTRGGWNSALLARELFLVTAALCLCITSISSAAVSHWQLGGANQD